jgi:phenylpropionate dioxygenase-like ring-hydroxylating dioxygenase large terminal subunit
LERALHRDFYFSDQLFALGRERIFCREWVCVRREEEVAEPGDYVSRGVPGEHHRGAHPRRRAFTASGTTG